MSDDTLTTAEVREDFALNGYGEHSPELAAEFDAWLAQHDAEVKAAALREAAVHVVFDLGTVSGSLVAVGDRAATWLDRRADRIDGGNR